MLDNESGFLCYHSGSWLLNRLQMVVKTRDWASVGDQWLLVVESKTRKKRRIDKDDEYVIKMIYSDGGR